VAARPPVLVLLLRLAEPLLPELLLVRAADQAL
jgi:hypothetical protein